MLKICLLALFVLYAHSQYFTKITLDNITEAKCLDGSDYGYYFHKGEGSGKNRFVFYLLGGGSCFTDQENTTLQSCYARASSQLGSMKNWPAFLPDSVFGGILSSYETVNPEFFNWNKVFLVYCDGGFHQGYKKQPMRYNNSNIYFRGEKNVKGVFKHLQAQLNFSEEVILTGGSAGGIATIYWADWVKEQLPKKTLYTAVPDSGIWPDWKYQPAPDYGFNKNVQKILFNET